MNYSPHNLASLVLWRQVVEQAFSRAFVPQHIVVCNVIPIDANDEVLL